MPPVPVPVTMIGLPPMPPVPPAPPAAVIFGDADCWKLQPSASSQTTDQGISDA